MQAIRPFLAVLAALALAAWSSARAEPELKSWLGSAFVVPGEETEIWLMMLSKSRPDPPTIPNVDKVGIKKRDEHMLPQRSRQNLYLYQYSIISYDKGTHTIPPFETTVDGRKVNSQPLDLHVADLPAEAWGNHRILGEDFPFAGAIFVPSRIPYEGETVPAEVKVYLPSRLNIADGSIAEIEQNGVVAWRFEVTRIPIPTLRGSRVFPTKVRLDGKDYTSISYRSTLTPIRAGTLSVGPGNARLTIGTQISSRGLSIRQNIATQLPVTTREFQARSLPPGAPPGFEKAVGQFQISAQADLAGLQEGDPISMRLSVFGTGNLDTLKPPKLDADPSEWKVYDPSRLARQGERRDVSGVVTFSQIIRPLGSQKVIPPFRLVSFNPKREIYETITTPPIPFEATPVAKAAGPAATLLPDLQTPVEEMETILGIIDSPRPHSVAASASRWGRSWHLVPALLSLLLLFLIARRHLFPRLGGPSREKDVNAALRDVEQAGPATRDFLRACGHFIELWIPGAQRDDEVASLLERRDNDAYRPHATEDPVQPDERRRIIDHLRGRALASVLALLAVLTFAPNASAATAPDSEALYRQAEAAWSEGSYRAAIEFYESAHPQGGLPADVFYNIANCHFQLGEQGLAALYYHRALNVDPDHAESLQNLRFLKRKTGAITVERPKLQEQLARLDRSLFSNLTWAGLWLLFLAALGFFAPLAKSLRILVWTGGAAGPFVALAGMAGLLFYPDDLEMIPAHERAIVVSNTPTKARTAASQSSGEVIPVPPGSLCRPLARRGPWTYVELANKTRGWLPSAVVRIVDPKSDQPVSAPLDLGA